MPKIPVSKDGKRGSEILLLDSNRILKIEIQNNQKYVLHTEDNAYYLDFSLESMEEWLFEDGFRMLDTTNIVNMNHVMEYNSQHGVVVLGTNTTNEPKTASAARIHKEHILRMMEILSQAKEPLLHFTPLAIEEAAIADPVGVTREEAAFSRSYTAIRAVNRRKTTEAKTVYLAHYDFLTDLPNRLYFQDLLEQAVQEARIEGKRIAVFFLNIDRFKVVNDTLGHQAGDALLQYVAKQLSSSVSANFNISRFSGDEFLIFLPNMNRIDDITFFANALRLVFDEPFLYEQYELFVTTSIGISIYPNDGLDASSLIKNANIAMYRAKEKGGGMFQIYHPEMNNTLSQHRLHLETQMRKALVQKQFVLYYQPILDLQSGEIVGIESLVRWMHPQWGLIMPSEFLPLAEETGLIIQIGNWIVEEACRQSQYWQSIGLPPYSLSVNISAVQFQQPGFVQGIKQMLEETKLPPQHLFLDITESFAMKNVLFMVDSMSRLKQIGVKIAIDDFGTGYSSLNYLKRFHVHTLKIDPSFIHDLSNDPDNKAIVSALIAMSRGLNIQTIAEGVESWEQLEFLKRQDCDCIQGYVFSEPLPANEFEQLLRQIKNLYSNK